MTNYTFVFSREKLAEIKSYLLKLHTERNSNYTGAYGWCSRLPDHRYFRAWETICDFSFPSGEVVKIESNKFSSYISRLLYERFVLNAS